MDSSVSDIFDIVYRPEVTNILRYPVVLTLHAGTPKAEEIVIRPGLLHLSPAPARLLPVGLVALEDDWS